MAQTLPPVRFEGPMTLGLITEYAELQRGSPITHRHEPSMTKGHNAPKHTARLRPQDERVT